MLVVLCKWQDYVLKLRKPTKKLILGIDSKKLLIILVSKYSSTFLNPFFISAVKCDYKSL